MGTKVVMLNGSKPTTAVLFRRNLYRLIPLDVFSFLFGKGFHDTISKTRVVMKKDFEHEANKWFIFSKISAWDQKDKITNLELKKPNLQEK